MCICKAGDGVWLCRLGNPGSRGVVLFHRFLVCDLVDEGGDGHGWNDWSMRKSIIKRSL